MRLAALASISALALLAACDRAADETTPEAAQAPAQTEAPAATARVEAVISDELPGISAAATGLAFWEHPSMPFNSLLIVANQDGVVAYNMENGSEVSRVDGFSAEGAAVSYFGLGARAAGIAAFIDAGAGAFRLFGVDNETRAFLPLEGAPAITGEVRDFCFGRSPKGATPTLFIVQETGVQFYNLAADADGVAVSAEGVIDTPGNLMRCAVDQEGALTLLADNGAVFRLDSDQAFEAPLAKAEIEQPGDIAVVRSMVGEGEDAAVKEQILVLDVADGALHVFNRDSGRPLGIVAYKGTDALSGVDRANVLGVSSANLGALYRNGILAFAAQGEEGPIVRITPASSLANALSLEVGEAVSPRGEKTGEVSRLQISVPEPVVEPAE